jgi:hypothetical protein
VNPSEAERQSFSVFTAWRHVRQGIRLLPVSDRKPGPNWYVFRQLIGLDMEDAQRQLADILDTRPGST